MEQVKVQDAIGMVLCHDLTEIIPGERKGVAFKKGHIIEEKDIEKLLDIGKKHIYVWNLEEGYVHENDAAARMIRAACGAGLTFSEVKEGKIEFKAEQKGVVKINKEALYQVNALGDICFATIHGNKQIAEGKLIGGCRVIPLVVEEARLAEFEKICKQTGPIVEVKTFRKTTVGIVTTGSEVKEGRIADKFGPVLRKKAEETDSEVIGQIFTGDEKDEIVKAIQSFIEQGVDLIEVTGGMSVDPDDMTPSAIKSLGGEFITYGAPVLPGAMFLLSYVKGIPVVGLPGCVMYVKRSIFDLIVPRLLTGELLTREDFIQLAYGGQCVNCAECTYPDCGFGA
jgi:hypothetical protein